MSWSIKGKLGKDRENEGEKNIKYWPPAQSVCLQSSAVQAYDNMYIRVQLPVLATYIKGLLSQEMCATAKRVQHIMYSVSHLHTHTLSHSKAH